MICYFSFSCRYESAFSNYKSDRVSLVNAPSHALQTATRVQRSIHLRHVHLSHDEKSYPAVQTDTFVVFSERLYEYYHTTSLERWHVTQVRIVWLGRSPKSTNPKATERWRSIDAILWPGQC